MKKILFILNMCWCSISFAQSVVNVRAFEEDGIVMVIYDLYTTKSEKEFYVTLKSSRNGTVFTPIYDASGDANKNVRVGSDHFILWSPKQSPGDSLVFKVEATPKKSYEQLNNLNELKEFHHSSGDIILTRAQRINNTIELFFTFKSSRDKGNIFITANLTAVDENNKSFHEMVVMQGNSTGPAISCDPMKTVLFKIQIPNVPENTGRLDTVTFSLSEITATFQNIKIEQ